LPERLNASKPLLEEMLEDADGGSGGRPLLRDPSGDFCALQRCRGYSHSISRCQRYSIITT
jgi:hypothetical protein